MRHYDVIHQRETKRHYGSDVNNGSGTMNHDDVMHQTETIDHGDVMDQTETDGDRRSWISDAD